ncbi:DinB family protein [Streptomyces sp. NRRL F-5126]|uniref:DinB family protein n=1 Tax=Streptomyces sp. NRRL F-5126 TaxID=1463857 RepID=UPI00068A2A2D|nr:DinB family protein [Streptomyces sp. NRRL F-5126]
MTPGDWRTLAARQFALLHADLTVLYTDAVDDWLHAAPPYPPGANTPAWLIWHIARGQDRNISELLGRAQLWTADGWADRFQRPRDPADTGLGHTTAQAAAFRVPPASGENLAAYAAAAHARTLGYLAAAPPSDAARPVTSPTLRNTHTVEERLAALVRDGFEHAGQLGLCAAAVRR